MSVLRIYRAGWCGACKTEVPRIQELGRRLGMSVRTIDIERCPSSLKPQCEAVSFVPHIELDGRAVSVGQLESMISKR